MYVRVADFTLQMQDTSQHVGLDRLHGRRYMSGSTIADLQV